MVRTASWCRSRRWLLVWIHTLLGIYICLVSGTSDQPRSTYLSTSTTPLTAIHHDDSHTWHDATSITQRIPSPTSSSRSSSTLSPSPISSVSIEAQMQSGETYDEFDDAITEEIRLDDSRAPSPSSMSHPSATAFIYQLSPIKRKKLIYQRISPSSHHRDPSTHFSSYDNMWGDDLSRSDDEYDPLTAPTLTFELNDDTIDSIDWSPMIIIDTSQLKPSSSPPSTSPES